MAHPPAACRRRRPPQSATFRSSRSSHGCSAAHKQATPFAAGRDWVFTTAHGTPHGHRNVTQRGLQRAARTAGLNDDGWPPLRFHDLRHTFASHLILDLGLDVAQVSVLTREDDGTIVLPLGEIAVQGGGQPPFAVTGGTGAFAGARGTLDGREHDGRTDVTVQFAN